MKTLYLHIGTGKTGTTAIQNFLFDNSLELERRFSVRYVKSGAVGSNHHGLCYNSYRHTENYEKADQCLRRLLVEIKESSATTFVASSEDFPGVTNAEVAEYVTILRSVCRLRIIVYFRRQDEFLESWFLQKFKAGNLGIEIVALKAQLIETGIFDYRHHVEKWSNHIGDKNVLVRSYQRSRFNSLGVVADFMSLLNIDLDDTSTFIVRSGSQNRSISKEQFIIVKQLMPFLGELILKRCLAPIAEKSRFGSQYLSSSERKSLIAECRDQNSWLERYSEGHSFFEDPKEDKLGSPNDFSISFLRKFVLEIDTRNQVNIVELKSAIIRLLRQKAMVTGKPILSSKSDLLGYAEELEYEVAAGSGLTSP